MFEYTLNNKTYIDLKEVRNECKEYCKGARTNNQLIEKKNIKDYIFGRVGIIDNELLPTEKLSRKFGSIFVNKEELHEIFNNQETLLEAPPLITDDDLVFFKDVEGITYNVPMRGERTQDGIFFRVKSVMEVFKMKNLNYDMTKPQTIYTLNEHYVFFNVSLEESLQNQQVKEMYLTYRGLRKVIETSRSGIGYKFKKWIDEVVFSAAFGTKKQKITTFKKVLNVDADHLSCIMSKSPTAISCLYLIDINVSDNGKRVFKYGFSNKITRRFKEHVKRYGDDIKLDTFILIPALDLSKAEADFKNCVSRYKYEKDGEDELISLCEESYINIQNIFKSVSQNYCGNVQDQISIYEQMVKDLKHSHEIQMNKLRNENIQNQLQSKLEISLKDNEIVHLQSKLEVSLKDNEILQLRLLLAQKQS